MKTTIGKKILRGAILRGGTLLLILILAGSLFSCESTVDALRQELLTGAVAEAEALTPEEWKSSSYAKVEDALAALREALSAEEPDEEAIQSAGDALQDALSALEKAADKSGLQKEYDRLSKLSLTGYTKITAAKLEAALSDAKILLADGDAAQEAVDRGVKSLTDAEKNLARPDKTELQTAYDRLSVLSLAGYTKATAEVLKAALDGASAVLTDEEASEDGITEAVTALKTAEDGLTRPDKTELQAEYDRLSALSLTGYTKASAEPLTAALNRASEILADEEASEDSITEAVTALKTAEEGLARPDKAELQAEYDRLSALSLTGYTDKSAGALKSALESAAAVLANEEAREDEVESAISAVKSAEEGLTKKASGGSTASGSGNGNGSVSSSGNSAGSSSGSSSGNSSSSGNGTPDSSTKAGRLEIAKAEAKKWVAENVKPGMTKMDIVEEIAYWFVTEVAQQTNQGAEAYKTNYGNEAYSAFVMKISACSGTCRAIKLICDEAGLACEHVNEGEWGHQWLRIQVDDGSWKVVDGQCGYVGDTEIGNVVTPFYKYVKWRQKDYDEVINENRAYYENLKIDDYSFTWDETLQYDAAMDWSGVKYGCRYVNGVSALSNTASYKAFTKAQNEKMGGLINPAFFLQGVEQIKEQSAKYDLPYDFDNHVLVFRVYSVTVDEYGNYIRDGVENLGENEYGGIATVVTFQMKK